MPEKTRNPWRGFLFYSFSSRWEEGEIFIALAGLTAATGTVKQKGRSYKADRSFQPYAITGALKPRYSSTELVMMRPPSFS